MSAKERLDVHQAITDRIVAAIETAGEFKLPWIADKGGRLARPVNITSGKAYNGINILSLWVSALSSEYSSNLWGTYRQWQERKCQVRKGEKSSLIVFYKATTFEVTDEDTGETESVERLVARASYVFNAAQVDGFAEASSEPIPAEPTFDPIAYAESFARATGAVIEEGGDMACYIPVTDKICMPDRRRFAGTDTTTPAEGYYSTLCHELVHNAAIRIMPHGLFWRPVACFRPCGCSE